MARPVVRPTLFACLFALVSCGESAPPVDLGVARTPAFAAVSSDGQASSAVSLLGPELEILAAPWLASDSTAPGLASTISADVVVAAPLGPDGAVTVIDRFGVDVLTRIAVPSGEVLGQLSLRSRTDQASFSSNPQDVAITGPGEAWVSRFGVNLDPTAPPEQRGNDLLGFDPRTLELDGRRIDLSRFDAPIDGPDGPVTAQARPTSLVQAGGAVWVGLARLFLAASVDGLRAAPGRVLRLDPDGEVQVVAAPPGLKNCVGLQQAGPDTLLVRCAGLPDQRAETSGLFELDVASAQIGRVFRPPGEEDAVPFYVLPFGDDRFLGVRTVGDLDGSACRDGEDELRLFDWEGGPPVPVATSAGCALTDLAPAPNGVLVADQVAGLRRFAETEGGLEEVPLELGLPEPVRSIVALEGSR